MCVLPSLTNNECDDENMQINILSPPFSLQPYHNYYNWYYVQVCHLNLENVVSSYLLDVDVVFVVAIQHCRHH